MALFLIPTIKQIIDFNHFLLVKATMQHKVQIMPSGFGLVNTSREFQVFPVGI